MQDIGPDMEDLLRRASEAYPLKQGDDRWDDIFVNLDNKPSATPVPIQHVPIKKYFTWGLLSVVALFSFLILNRHEKQNHTKEIKEAKYTTNLLKNKKEEGITTPGNRLNKTLSILVKQPPTNSVSFSDRKRGLATYGSVNNDGVAKQNSASEWDFDRVNSMDRNFSLVGNAWQGIRLQPLKSGKKLSTPHKLFLQQFARWQQVFVTPNEKESAKTKYKPREDRVYYGLLSGAHINAVKDQPFKKPGLDIGILAGYKLHKRVAVEAGVLFAEKYYYTPGKYFSMDKMSGSMPAGTKMIEVYGSSRVLEVPLRLRYDLSLKKNHRVFSSAGVSSFVLTEETNKYHTMFNGTEGNMLGNYKKNKLYLAGAVDVVLGYESAIGTKSHIRIEPYLQLPIKGIGVGQLQIKTAGLRIGLTRLK